MNPDDLLRSLIKATKPSDVETALAKFSKVNPGSLGWRPVGRENNRGTIEAASDPGRSLVERLTNAIDAVLELEHQRHKGVPECHSPKEAASAWLNVPVAGGLSALKQKQRQELANRVVLHELDGPKEQRTVQIRDRGVGIRSQDIPNTILSLNESNKTRKLYLMGAYGQGGSSTFAASVTSLLASRHYEGGKVGVSDYRVPGVGREGTPVVSGGGGGFQPARAGARRTGVAQRGRVGAGRTTRWGCRGGAGASWG